MGDNTGKVAIAIQSIKDMRADLIKLHRAFRRQKEPAFTHLAPFHPHAAGQERDRVALHAACANASPGDQAPGQGLPFT